ncbi:MAG TPA: type II toxin-antitoxin system prevent-host-death family antitoxin [Bryobacteraceae bacterium]|jgi:prevent-host-death family protein|nr:type II toxin-antitoxin system prevent-host-death family antitoxin [Bryobacteraceae bacterium]
MRKASIRDLHIHTSELVREAAEGSVIVIERRGEPVAELRPLTNGGKLTPAARKRIWTQMEKIWARMPQVPDSSRIIEEDRSR